MPARHHLPHDKNKRVCPLCQAPEAETWRPFCSERCRDLDLFRWLNGSYTIPETTPEVHSSTLPEKDKAPGFNRKTNHEDPPS